MKSDEKKMGKELVAQGIVDKKGSEDVKSLLKSS